MWLDDPLSLLGVAVWLMAAGMWPVGLGYMFGVCSKCCDCASECSKCTHFYNDTQCDDLIDSITLSANGSTFTKSGLCEYSQVDNEETLFFIDNTESLPQCVYDDWPFGIDWSAIAEFEVRPGTDECGCPTLLMQAAVILRLLSEGLVLEILAEDFVDITSCEGGTQNFEFEFSVTQNDFGENFSPECVEQIVDFMKSGAVDVSGSVTVNGCDCGACCDNETCEDEVAEGGCDNWAGVGTACDDDPNPCEEE